MATEAPEAIGAVEKTKQARAAGRAGVAKAKSSQAVSEQKTRQSELALQKQREAQAHQAARDQYQQQVKERASGGQERKSQASLPSLPSATRGDSSKGHRTMAAVWLLGLGIISFQEVKANSRPPDPDKITGWSAAIAILDLIAPLISWEFSGVLAIGLVVGLAIFRKPAKDAMPGTPPGLTGTVLGNGKSVKSGTTVNSPPKVGSGYWFSNGDGTDTWVPFMSQQQAQANGFDTWTPSSPGSWGFDPVSSKWFDMSKISITDPRFNPKVAP